MKVFIIVLTSLLLFGCTSKKPSENLESNYLKDSSHANSFALDSVYGTDYVFLADSVFSGLKEVLRFYVNNYDTGQCKALVYPKKYLKESFEPPIKLGNIRKNVPTSVFVLLPFRDCSNIDEMSLFGKDYYFTDTTLPKLSTDAGCSHPSDIFSVGDIDEDGICEIGEHYSSCVGHYKSLIIWTLKKKKWVEVGKSMFDQHFMTYDRPFSSYVKKLSKGRFAMFEKTDLPKDPQKTLNGYWIKFKM